MSGAACDVNPDREESYIIATVLKAANDPYGQRTIEHLTHEIGHDFLGAGHCESTPGCVMRPVSHVPERDRSVYEPQPFCEPCASDLELAGYVALAASLNKRS